MAVVSSQYIAIIIPARNEEVALSHLLTEMPADLKQQLIIVDNGSTDGTAKVVLSAGVQVQQEMRPGYGYACWSSFQQAREQGAELLVFLDGDGSDNPADLPKLLQVFHEQDA